MDKKLLLIFLFSIGVGIAIFIYLPTYIPQTQPFFTTIQTTLTNFWTWFSTNILSNPIAFFTGTLGAIGGIFTIYSAYKNTKAKTQEMASQLSDMREQMTTTFNTNMDSIKQLKESYESKITDLKTQIGTSSSQLTLDLQNKVTTLSNAYTQSQNELAQTQEDLRVAMGKIQALQSITVQKVVP